MLLIFTLIFKITFLKKMKTLGFCIAVHRSPPLQKRWSPYSTSIVSTEYKYFNLKE